jgi:hypothetical protein
MLQAGQHPLEKLAGLLPKQVARVAAPLVQAASVALHSPLLPPPPRLLRLRLQLEQRQMQVVQQAWSRGQAP